jgi:hypothetical protein
LLKIPHILTAIPVDLATTHQRKYDDNRNAAEGDGEVEVNHVVSPGEVGILLMSQFRTR